MQRHEDNGTGRCARLSSDWPKQARGQRSFIDLGVRLRSQQQSYQVPRSRAHARSTRLMSYQLSGETVRRCQNLKVDHLSLSARMQVTHDRSHAAAAAATRGDYVRMWLDTCRIGRQTWYNVRRRLADIITRCIFTLCACWRHSIVVDLPSPATSLRLVNKTIRRNRYYDRFFWRQPSDATGVKLFEVHGSQCRISTTFNRTQMHSARVWSA